MHVHAAASSAAHLPLSCLAGSTSPGTAAQGSQPAFLSSSSRSQRNAKAKITRIGIQAAPAEQSSAGPHSRLPLRCKRHARRPAGRDAEGRAGLAAARRPPRRQHHPQPVTPPPAARWPCTRGSACCSPPATWPRRRGGRGAGTAAPQPPRRPQSRPVGGWAEGCVCVWWGVCVHVCMCAGVLVWVWGRSGGPAAQQQGKRGGKGRRGLWWCMSMQGQGHGHATACVHASTRVQTLRVCALLRLPPPSWPVAPSTTQDAAPCTTHKCNSRGRRAKPGRWRMRHLRRCQRAAVGGGDKEGREGQSGVSIMTDDESRALHHD